MMLAVVPTPDPVRYARTRLHERTSPVTLSDIDVAVLAGQAVGLLDDDVLTEIDPADPTDPYLRRTAAWTVWPMLERHHRTLSIRVLARWTPAQALGVLCRALSEHVSAGTTFWAHTFPVCPGHQHASRIEVVGAEVVLSCPIDGSETARIEPAVG